MLYVAQNNVKSIILRDVGFILFAKAFALAKSFIYLFIDIGKYITLSAFDILDIYRIEIEI